jgi:hypothetical protein
VLLLGHERAPYLDNCQGWCILSINKRKHVGPEVREHPRAGASTCMGGTDMNERNARLLSAVRAYAGLVSQGIAPVCVELTRWHEHSAAWVLRQRAGVGARALGRMGSSSTRWGWCTRDTSDVPPCSVCRRAPPRRGGPERLPAARRGASVKTER